ncbi:MAG: KpsF/GutQ family sugar-phosphate isomerase [Planctomycetota bacterium]
MVNNANDPSIHDPEPSEANDGLVEVRRVLQLEADSILSAARGLDDSIQQVLDKLYGCQGRVIVTGMGKMSCIARKAVATFCSTGTPAVFLHPSEAVHGDLGIVSDSDVLLALSNSGETREVLELLPFMKRFNVDCLAVTRQQTSSLAARCIAVIHTGVTDEADSIAAAPTNSTTVTLAICDALAVALMKRRGFTAEQFAIFHPGGFLGGKLLLQTRDLMHTGDRIPLAFPTETLHDGIGRMSEKGLGAVFVVNPTQQLVGVVTDGDLRRIIQRVNDAANALNEPLQNWMNQQPRSIHEGALAAESLKLMEDHGITVLPVVNEQTQIVGVIHLHDLIRAGLA